MAPSLAVQNTKLQRPLRGFTLIELMVALTAGLFFSVAVFMLMRDVSRYFQRESRVADATMGAILGFERLKADVARAGYLASPLLLKDPRRCPKPPAALNSGGWGSFLPLSEMGALYITPGGAGVNMTAGKAMLAAQIPALAPDRIRMYGNYQTAEQFAVETITSTGSIQLSIVGAGALLRLGYNPTGLASELDALVLNAFPPGRALRIVSPEGDEQYGIIQNAVTVPDGPNRKPVIQVGPTLNLRFKATEPTCGINGGAANGYLVNTVNIIEYELDDTFGSGPTADYQDLLGNTAEPWARTDLVRFEVDPQTGTQIAGTRELVAEYAVDVRFGVTAVTNPLTGQMASFASGDAIGMAPYTTFAGAAAINSGPHLLRGVRAQLSVRSRAPDRDAQINTPPGGGIYRVLLPGAGAAAFARVRTLSATIATRNTRGMLWQ